MNVDDCQGQRLCGSGPMVTGQDQIRTLKKRQMDSQQCQVASLIYFKPYVGLIASTLITTMRFIEEDTSNMDSVNSNSNNLKVGSFPC